MQAIGERAAIHGPPKLFLRGTPAFLRLVKRKPPAVSRRRFSWRSVVRRSGSEVALHADVQSHRVLVLGLVGGDRLRSRRHQRRSTSGILGEVEEPDFA